MQTHITDLKGNGAEGVGWGEIIGDLGILKRRQTFILPYTSPKRH